MNNSIKSEAPGKVGTVYTSRKGNKEHNFTPNEGEGKIGWLQKTSIIRIKVERIRVSVNDCEWVEFEETITDRDRGYLLPGG